MRCFHCHHKNPNEMRFCGNCGQPLRVGCGNCRAVVPYARFCGNCGVGLAAPGQVGEAASVAVVQAIPTVSAASAETVAPPVPAPANVEEIHRQVLEAAVQGDAPTDLAEKYRIAATDMGGERRKVVVMFSDVSGFTAMSEKMDPEQIHTIMNECFNGLVNIIYKYEGYIDKFIGDCIMALFGAPISHEDDVARSLFAILEMQTWIDNYSSRLEKIHGVTVGMHTGLNYGTVIAGGLGSDLRMDYTVIGDTVNVASRLESKAERGQTFVSETMYAIGRKQFTFREVEPLTLKGKSQPVAAYEILAVRDDPEALRGVEGLPSVLVGRDDEMASLLERLSDVKGGKGRVVSVVGEPGVGKSRLVSEFVRRARQDGLKTLRAACLSYTTNVPYFIFHELLMQWCDIEETDPPDVARMKLRAALAATGENYDGWEVYLQSLLNAEAGNSLAGLDPQTRQRLTDRAVAESFLALGRREPVVLVCDDLHWLDDSSTRVLHRLALENTETSLFIAAIYRQEFKPDWDALEHHSTVRLHVLSGETTADLIHALLGKSDLPRSLFDLIVRKSNGNPFFTEEVLRAFIDTGVLAKEGDGWHLAKEPTDVTVPDSLHAVIMGRMDRLPEEARRFMQTASVVGPTFQAVLLSELGWTLSRILPHVENLTELQFLLEMRPLPDLELAFKQDFIREVSYNTLLLKTRRQWHGEVGAAMERCFAERLKEHVEILAYHYSQAEEWFKAVSYLKESAQKAREIYANQSAMDAYRRLLELSERAEYPNAHQKVLDQLDAYEGLGEVQKLVGEYDAALATYAEYLRVVEASGLDAQETDVRRACGLRNIADVHTKRSDYATALDFLAQADACLRPANGADSGTGTDAEIRERSRIAGQVGFIRFRQGDYPAAAEQSRKSADLAERIHSDKEIAYAHLVLGLSSYSQGRLEDAISCYQYALEIRERIGDVTGVAAVLQNLGNVYIDQGKYADAEREYQRCLAIREKTGDVAGSANVYNQLGNVRLSLGDYDGAADCYSHCKDIFGRIGNRFGLAVSLNNIGQIENERKQPDAARRHLREALEVVQPLNVKDLLADIQVALARAELDANLANEAEPYARGGLEIALEIGNKPVEAGARWIVGRLEAAKGNLLAAEEQLTESLALHESLKMARGQGRAAVSRAEVLTAQGNTSRARADLETAARLFRELGLPEEVERVEVQLNALTTS